MIVLATGIFALYGFFWMTCFKHKSYYDKLIDDEAQLKFIEDWQKARCGKIF